MKRFWIRRGLRFLVFALLFVGLAGLAVMTLWNALLPAILGVSAINFWQALGMLVLSRILFGGVGRGGWGRGGYGPSHRRTGRAEWKQKMTARWQNMTPEQREQMKQQWRDKCGGGRRGRDQRGRGPQPEQPNSGEPTEPDSTTA
ncbi:hypothetical protein [Spirosoma arcticum]